MKRVVLFAVTVALCAGSVFAQDAASIMQTAKDHTQADTMSSRCVW
jgi:hypothetical protein